MRRSRWPVVWRLALLAGAALVIGYMERQDVQAEQGEYCSMVASHTWPDFHHSYAKECRK